MTLDQVLKANQKRAQERAEKIKRTKELKEKEQRKENITSFILGFSVATFISLIVLIGIYNERQLEKCIEKTNDRVYCERVL